MFYCPNCNYIFDITKNAQKSMEGEKNDNEQVFFNCNNCGNVKAIKSGTLILSKTYGNVTQNYISDNDKVMSNSKILPHTKNYVCANKDCITHKEPIKKDAKFFKPNKSYRVKYICMVCSTIFEL